MVISGLVRCRMIWSDIPDGFIPEIGEQLRMLVIGTSALGEHLTRFGRDLGAQVRNPGKYNLDVTRSDRLSHEMALYRPHLVINCAEKANLADCERRPEHAIAINSVGAAKVALVCRLNDIPLIHISTDLVFHGFGVGGPYTSLDETYPVNAYGLSKLIGEKAVSAFKPGALIVRLGWLYGAGIEDGPAFDAGNSGIIQIEGHVKNVTKRAWVPAKQLGKPTHVGAAAFTIIRNVRLNDFTPMPDGGIVHLAPEGIPVTWYDFLVEDFPLVEEVDPRKANMTHPQVTLPHKGGLVPTPGWETENYAVSMQRFREELEGRHADIKSYAKASEST